MLSKNMYTNEYIQLLHKKTGNDPALLERVVFAFGLLEAIRKVGLPFCFKGGTALMLLLEHPRRLSTDIDIIVEPGINIDVYIQRAGELFPFLDVEENIRVGRNSIEKRHFRFRYRSPRSEKDVTILLDVVFEDTIYESTIELPIKNEFLLTEGENLTVSIPSINGILGDKLTAFAPHTTGIPFGISKEMEIIKQLFDCGSLVDAMTDLNEVRKSYRRIVKSEIEYRGLDISANDVLEDTIRGCLCISGRCALGEADYEHYKDGISRIRNHILGLKLSGETAGAISGRVLFLAASLLCDQEMATIIDSPSSYGDGTIEFIKPKRFYYLKLVDPTAYRCIVQASILLQRADFHE